LPRDNLYLINRAKGRPWAPAGPRWHSCWPTPPRHPYEHIEDVDGAVMFRQACVMGLEGVVAARPTLSLRATPGLDQRTQRIRRSHVRSWSL